MSDDPKKSRPSDASTIEAALSALIGTLGQAIGQAAQGLDATKSSEMSQTVDTPFGPIKTSAGVRLRVGGLATPKSPLPQPVNPRRAAPKPPTAAARELPYDLFEDEGQWILTADLPGVAQDEVAVTAEDGALLLQTTGARAFRARIALPFACAPERIQTALTNGVLTLTFPKEVQE